MFTCVHTRISYLRLYFFSKLKMTARVVAKTKQLLQSNIFHVLRYYNYTYNNIFSALQISSAVAKRLRDASCLSVVRFVASIVQYLESSFLLLVTSASDLLVHTIRFCSVVFSVTSSLAVIHTICHDCV